MDEKTARISERLIRIFNKYVENQKIPRKYGLEEFLYPAEVHMITLIGGNPRIGVTDLADLAGVTKGAVSQMTQRLVNKGLITKERDSEAGNRVIFELTNKGKVAYYSHQRMHDEIDRELFSFVGGLGPGHYKTIERFLRLIEHGIDKRSET